MKKFRLLIFLFTGLLVLQGCDTLTSGSDSDVITASDERQFVWNGLNFWYFWQDRVPDLDDERKNDIRSFNQFLNEPIDERALFENLKFKQEDDFSWFIDDYEVHEDAMMGTSKSFGFRYGLGQEVGITGVPGNNVFGYVQYVVEGSPADEAGLKRGDIFRGINGENLTMTNYLQLLGNEVYDLRMASVRKNDNGGYQIQNSNETVQVHSEIINENPIHTSHIYNFGSKTVGYLLYNSFRLNYHNELNNLFETFKAEGVNELVLDLRYNGGGTVITSALLASMISGVSANAVFAEFRFNNKRSANNAPYTFYENVPIYDESGTRVSNDTALNSLGLSRVYILTSNRTASASETLINGFKPYGVEVVVIGWETIGKDEGSITVYDAPSVSYSPRNSQRSEINPNHKRAMQPIVFKIFNANGEDYPNGFAPSPGTTAQREFDYLEEGLPPLGDPEEHLFKSALEHMNGTLLAKERATTEIDLSMHFMDSSELIPFHDHMYILPSDLERISKEQE